MLKCLDSKPNTSTMFCCRGNKRPAKKPGIGGEATSLWGLCACVRLCDVLVSAHDAQCIFLCWSEGTLVFEGEAPESPPGSWVPVLFSHCRVPVIRASIICRSKKKTKQKKQLHFSFFYLCVELCMKTMEVEPGMWKTKLSRECNHTPLFTVHCWVMVCPILLPPTTHISSNVSLWLHMHKNCCANLHFSIPCHHLWYIDIKYIFECHKMSLQKSFIKHSTTLTAKSPKSPLSR